MSILWGTLNLAETSVNRAAFARLGRFTRRYASSDGAVFVGGQVGMGLQPYFSHARSRLDLSPMRSPQGNCLCWDGRLDNYREITSMLQLPDSEAPDSAIVLAAFEQWGDQCFSRLVGDWALALWDDQGKRLILARDHAGSRSLYFSSTTTKVCWATYLDTLASPGADLSASDQYAAAYLSCSPTGDLTPYEKVYAVRPGHAVVFQNGQVSHVPHWSPLNPRTLRYRQDAEYDDHFLAAFGTAVQRRSEPGDSVLAQLSGGMDSTSIVCISDHMRRQSTPEAEILDTLSFFDDSESSLDERRYFAITEAARGKVGTHLEVRFSQRTFDPPLSEIGTYHMPGQDSFSVALEQTLQRVIWDRGFRSILSGIGGDELLGGIPNGLPELADHLAAGHLVTFLQSAVAWSLPERVPLLATSYHAARYALRLYTRSDPNGRPMPPWVSPQLAQYRNALQPLGNPSLRLGIAPHRLEAVSSWWHVMETLPHLSPQILFRPEYRYPMLDRDLVDFLLAVPPEQLVRPGRRRAMMRRALRGIVPQEILERRRKAFQLRAPMSSIRSDLPKLERLFSDSLVADLGWIDVDRFRAGLRRTADGSAVWYQAILRTIAYELWLRARGSQTPRRGMPLASLAAC